MFNRRQYHIMLPDFEGLTEIHYCVNCVDCGSQLVGSFAYDEELYNLGCGLWAISPVFESVDNFYYWAKTHGFRYHDLHKMFTLSKTFV